MIVLSGADLVLPDRIISNGTLEISGDRISSIRSGGPPDASPSFALRGHYIVPGFIDVHVHGVGGIDSLGDGETVRAIAARLPRYGVTAFCPTSVACPPAALGRMLMQVREARRAPAAGAARVLPAHLESNFVNPEFAGAQPRTCLRIPSDRASHTATAKTFTAADILREIERAAPDVGLVTLAPELDGALPLIRELAGRGHRVSLGHSGATYEQAVAAIAAGARHATHLYNRMAPLHHREPGLAGAVLQAEEVAAEIICDGVHVHPAIVRATLAAKRASKVIAITDGTALSGIPPLSRGALGEQSIVADTHAARLLDGTLAGSTCTMDRVFRMLVADVGVSLVDAAAMCATTPARELGLVGYGMLDEEAFADLVVLDGKFDVVQTYVAGQLVYTRSA